MADSFNLWVLVTPAEDVPGEWVGHCLDLDVVSQGVSSESALEATKEAVLMVLRDALGEDRHPMEGRRRAPQGYWNQLSLVLRDGVTSETKGDRLALRSEVQAMATKLKFVHEGENLVDLSPMWRLFLV